MTLAIILGLVGLSLGIGSGFFIRKISVSKKLNTLEEKADQILKDARSEAEDLLLKAKSKAIRALEEVKKEKELQEGDIIRRSKHLEKRELMLETRENSLDKEKKAIEKKVEDVKEVRDELDRLKKQAMKRLEKVAGMTKLQAKKEFIRNFDEETKKETKSSLRKIEEENQEVLNEKAKEVMTIAMQRLANSHSAEITISNVSIPSDEMKGRIIGKEGRNIRRLEELTGVEILVDETPEMIIISGFDPTRRYLAKLALDKLVADGRIHPTRIEEAVAQSKVQLKQLIKKEGEAAAAELGIVDFDSQLLSLLGRLKFRSSYAQNVLKHSVEVAKIAAGIAREIGANVNIVKKAGLLHDIGKAIDREVEGSHTEIGIRVLKKFKVDEKVIKAMQSHHEEYPYECLEARIIQVADAISSSRVGARKDSLENYLIRLREIEDVANNFEGVDQTYAIQAGRELRVFVSPEKIDDLEAIKLAKDIAKKIERTLKYPGDIKITLIRRMKVEEIAK